MPQGPRSRRKTAAVALLILAVVGGLRYGGVQPHVAALITAAALTALALSWPRRMVRAPSVSGRDADPRQRGMPLLAVGLLAGVVVVAFQLVPLPPALLRVLSPNAAALFEETLAPIGRWPAWRPLSLAPGETAFLLVVAVATASAATAAAFLGENRRRTEVLLGAMAFTGLAASLVGMVAAALGMRSLVGPSPTFVNSNHLAGFLQLCAWPALGFALRARGKERVGWLATFSLTSTGIFLTLSRGGISAFFVSAGISSVLAMLHGHTPLSIALFAREQRHARRTAGRAPEGSEEPASPARLLRWARGATLARSLALPVGVASALAVAAWLALDPILTELQTLSSAASEVKPHLWPAGLRLVRQFPVTGIGRGAFATVYPSLKTETIQVTFSHLENTWLQLPVDVGLVAGLALLGLFTWAWVAAARQPGLSRPMIGALAGAAGVAAHNVVDFSLELVGVALPFAIVLGLASRAMPRVRVPRAVGFGAVAVLSGLALAGHLVRARAVGDEAAVAISKAESLEDAAAIAGRALAWRPADWVPPAAAGVRIVAAGKCAQGVPWLVRAMARNPTAPEPHRYAARCLAASGQAALAKQEFRLAFLFGDRDALAEALRRFPNPGQLLDIAPETLDGLITAARLLDQRPAEALEAWRRAWEQFLDPRALAGMAWTTLALGDDAEALRLARELQRVAPENANGWQVATRALENQGDAAAGLAELEKGAGRMPGVGGILVPLGLRHLEARRPSRARSVFEQIVAREGPELATKKLLIAQTFWAQGRLAEALALAQDAAATDRSSPGPLEAVARYAEELGRYDLAIDALERAGRLPDRTPERYDAEISKLKRAPMVRAR